jgi:hypothetical protein
VGGSDEIQEFQSNENQPVQTMNTTVPPHPTTSARSPGAHPILLPRRYRCRLPALTALALGLFTGQALAGVVVANGGFEVPPLPVDDLIRYSASIAGQGGSGWEFQNYFAGVTAKGSGFFDGVDAAIPEGSQFAVLQQWSGMHDDLAGFSQQIAGFSDGTYLVSFYAAGRQGYGGANPFTVDIDGLFLAFGGLSIITPRQTASGLPFQSYTSDPLALSGGTHTLRFRSAGPQDSSASFIDGVRLASIDVNQAGSVTAALGTVVLYKGPEAGGDDVALTISPAGPWTATANDPWLHLGAADQSGSGSATVAFTLDANPSATRRGTLMIAGRTLTITQFGAHALGTDARLVGPAAGVDSVTLAFGGGAKGWTATANAPWLHLKPGNQSGSGSTSVVFGFDANPGATRVGTLTVAGQTLTVTQAGSTYVAARPLITLASTELYGDAGIAVDGSGSVYFSSAGYGWDRGDSIVGVPAWLLKWASIDGQVSQVMSLDINPRVLRQGASVLVVDSAGDFYLGTSSNGGSSGIPGGIRHGWVCAIEKRSATDGTASVLLETDGGHPPPRIHGFAVDGPGNVYFSVSEEGVIKKRSAATAEVTTLFKMWHDHTSGVAVDGAGNVYISLDGNNLVRKWTAADDTVDTLIASGLRSPRGLAVDGSGNVYIADSENHAIKKWTAADGRLTTLVALGLELPQAVAVDANGGIYFTVGNEFGFQYRVLALANAFVDPGPILLTAAAGGDVLPAVLPASQNLRAPQFAPTSDQSWLTITGVADGVVSYSFEANDTSAARTAHISLLGTSVAITQVPAGTAPFAPTLIGPTWWSQGRFQLMFEGAAGASYSVLFSTNPALPLSEWTVAGSATAAIPRPFARLLSGAPAKSARWIGGTVPFQSVPFQFTDRPPSTSPSGFYRVVSP